MGAAVSDLRESDFAAQVKDIANIYGYEYAHFRPALTKHGWRTPVAGTLGHGWPDYVFVREHDRRLIFAELKAGKRTPSIEQERVMNVLRSLETGIRPVNAARVEVFVWWPDDIDRIAEILR